MGALREELRRNLTNAGAVLVGWAELRGKLPYPSLPRVVSFAVKLEPASESVWDYARAYFEAEDKIALLEEHAKACLRRYGFAAEVAGERGNPDTEFPVQTAAIAAHLAERDPDGLLVTPDFGRDVRFGTVFTDATWKKTE